MRASATSKTSPAANYAAAQAKPNANKADEASPFALLVGMATPKDNVQGRPSQKDTSNSTDRGNSTDKGADDKSAKAQDNQADTTQTASSVSANSKPEKSDKSSNEDDVKASDVRASDDKASDSKDSDQPVSAIDSQDQQALQQALVTLD